MVESYKELVKRVTECLNDKKQRQIYYEEDAENFILIGQKDIKQFIEIMHIETCGNFDYDFKPVNIETYKIKEKELFGDNKISSTIEEVIEREVVVILTLMNEELSSK